MKLWHPTFRNLIFLVVFVATSSIIISSTFLSKDNITDQTNQIILHVEQDDSKDIKVKERKRFLLQVPEYGPNNQFFGTVETFYLAKHTNRSFVCPDFWIHQRNISNPEDLRTFNSTFDFIKASQYTSLASFDEFRMECNGAAQVVIWQRKYDETLDNILKNYMKHHNLGYAWQVYAPNDLISEEWFYNTHESIKTRFEPYVSLPCVVLAFPFRNLLFSHQEETMNFLHHTENIYEIFTQAFDEMQVNSNRLMTFHWRFPEDSCVEFPPTEEFDFCFGTSVYHYTTLESVIKVILQLAQQEKYTHIYVALANQFEPVGLYNIFKKRMQEQNITIVRSKDLKSISTITDNYYLSLVEQELCQYSGTFIASSDSSWSEWIMSFRKYVLKKPLETSYYLHKMLENNNQPHSKFNLFVEREKRDQASLLKEIG